MKRYLCATVAIALFGSALIGTTTSCSNKDEKKDGKKEAVAKKKKEPRDTVGLPNYRYVDSDTLLSKYNLAKDYQEEILRMQQNIENTQRQRATAIQNFANQIQQKGQNNQYTEQTYQADMNKLSQMQRAAEEEIGRMQMNATNQAAQLQKTINDSIENYVERYNKAKGYDAILMKAATIYINPNMDITDEIVEGLNRSYNKK